MTDKFLTKWSVENHQICRKFSWLIIFVGNIIYMHLSARNFLDEGGHEFSGWPIVHKESSWWIPDEVPNVFSTNLFVGNSRNLYIWNLSCCFKKILTNLFSSGVDIFFSSTYTNSWLLCEPNQNIFIHVNDERGLRPDMQCRY